MIPQLFDEAELELLRRQLVKLWAAWVPHAEIARRLSIPLALLAERYGRQLSDAPAKRAAADEMIEMNWRAKSGDTAAAMLLLVASSFDEPAFKTLLACPDVPTVH